MQIPFFNELAKGERFLIAGAGGGYDITHGIPLYLYLTKTLGKEVVLANFSFTELPRSGAVKVFDGTYKITKDCAMLNYFPENLICQWLWNHLKIDTSIYAFDYELGVQPLRQAYNYLIDQYQLDTVLLVDGGTDSVIFGDEQTMGTIVEDANSMIAAVKSNAKNKYIAAIGFGIDHFHGVNHYNFLENVATLIHDGGYLGAFSLTKEMPEGKEYLALTQYIHQHSHYPSIVNNSIAGAMSGDFGDIHATQRTEGSELFINPLMPLYWTFKLETITQRMEFASLLENTLSIQDVKTAIQRHKIYKNGQFRHNQPIPL